jgi:hypothetical protein
MLPIEPCELHYCSAIGHSIKGQPPSAKQERKPPVPKTGSTAQHILVVSHTAVVQVVPAAPKKILPDGTTHFGCYTKETSPVWGASDRLIGQGNTKSTKTTTSGQSPGTVSEMVATLIQPLTACWNNRLGTLHKHEVTCNQLAAIWDRSSPQAAGLSAS